MIKKILAMMFCVILLASQSVIAQEEDYAYFEPAAYSEAVQFMTALGIMNKEDDSLTTEDWTISRGEFTKLALMAVRENGIAESLSLTSPFMDVGEEHPYFKAIVFAAQTNYFGKDIGTFFRPDDALTMEFAARLGVALTGRSILIGGSRTYVSVANSIDLFDKVETYEKDKISRGGALMFLKNVLEANPLTADSAGTDGKITGVKTDKSKTVLTNTLGLEKREGVVTSDGLTTVYGEKPTVGYITIDGEKYLNLYESAYGLAGKDVRFDTSALQPGTEYAFYLDSFGEVAYVTTDGGTMAYLLEVAKGTGLSDTVQVQVLSEDTGKLTVYDLASNVLMETPTAKESKKRAEVYNMLLDGANCRRQMVLVKFNDNEEIKAITTPMEITTYRQALTAPEYPLYHLPYLVTEWPEVLGGSGTDMAWRYTVGGFSRWIILGSGAQMFHVPNGNDAISDPDSVATEQLDYGNREVDIDKDMGYYTKDIQDISVRYLVNYGSVAEEDPTKSQTWPRIVTDIVECYSEKLGDSTYRLTLAGESGDEALLTLDSTVIQRDKLWEASELRADKTQLEVGDVIRYAADDAGYIRKISVIYDAKDGIEKDYNDNGDTAARFGTITSAYTQTTWRTTDFTGNVGNLVRKRGNVIELSIDKTPTIQTETERLQRFTWGVSNTAIMVDYSGPRPKVTRGYSANDLVVGDRILSIGRAGQYYFSFAYRR